MKEMLHFTDEAISTEYSALMSKVVTDGNGAVKFPINEPAEAQAQVPDRRVPRVLRGPGGPAHGGRHARHRGHGGLDCAAAASSSSTSPTAYYDEVPARAPEVASRLADLRAQGILVDRDDDGYLLQIFTKPVGDRPTVFFEVIERHGARGFGDGNFKALFEALEREQAARGNL